MLDLERYRFLTRSHSRNPLVGSLSSNGFRILEHLLRTKTSAAKIEDKRLVKLASDYNLASLILMHVGDGERAYQLCNRAIGFFNDFATNSQNYDYWISMTVQPFINLARLDAYFGRVDLALSAFENIYRWSLGELPLNLGVASISKKVPQSIRDESLLNVCRNCYAVDSARAYLLVGDFLGLLELDRRLEFVFTNDSLLNVPWLRSFLSEIRLRAFAGLNDVQNAITEANKLYTIFKENRKLNPGALLLIPRLERSLDRCDAGKKNLITVEQYLKGFDPKMEDLGTWYELAIENLAFGNYRRAGQVARELIARSAQRQNFPMQIKSLIVLLVVLSADPALSNYNSEVGSTVDSLMQLVRESDWACERTLGCLVLGCSSDRLSGFVVPDPEIRYWFRTKCIETSKHLKMIHLDRLRTAAKEILQSENYQTVCKRYHPKEQLVGDTCIEQLYRELMSLRASDFLPASP